MNDDSVAIAVTPPEFSGPSPSAGPEKTPGPVPDYETTVGKLGRRQLRRFMSRVPKVLGGDSPAVHDLRVASRRLEQILDLLYPAPAPADIRKARRKLRRARRVLSELRNCDVLLKNIDAALGHKRVSRAEAWQAVRNHLVERRADESEKALRKLAKVNTSGLYLRLRQRLAPGRESPTSRSSAHLDDRPNHDHPHAEGASGFPERAQEYLGSAWQAFEMRIKASKNDLRPETIHRARIAVKRLRYRLEVMSELGFANRPEALVELRRLQRHLGDWHDADMMQEAMIDVVARRSFVRQHTELAIEIQQLILANRTARTRYEQRYSRMGTDSSGLSEVARLVTAPPEG